MRHMTTFDAESMSDDDLLDVLYSMDGDRFPERFEEVRAEFSLLESEGRLSCNADTGDWQLTENASLQDAS